MLLFAKVSIQNIAAYRFDLIVRLVMSFVHLGAELLAVWTIYYNVESICGWTWMHMLVLVGVFRMVAGGIRMSIVPNMRALLADIRDGTLDFVLLKPVRVQFLVSIREFVVWRVTDVLLGAIVAGYGCVKLTGTVAPRAAMVFLLMMVASAVIVYSIWLMLATLCFWFVKVDNIEMVFWNVFEAGRYPIDVYRPWVQWSLKFVIPMAFITTFPAGALVGEPGMLPSAAPIYAFAIAAILFGLSGWFFHYGLRHYSGASA